MKSPIRFGVLGYAGIAQKHLIPAMMEANNAVPYAIASRSEEK
ncbi:MAG: gfo/Idh/MocA family oxidoreductase, partial [Clostridiales bacterium]|nr:gfo/Idh/MocA family oxidoreductase [Clostridiales bacterium]